MATKKCEEFMKHNEKYGVVRAHILPKDAAPNNVTGSRYYFENGSTRTLTVEDSRSSPEGWSPYWGYKLRP